MSPLPLIDMHTHFHPSKLIEELSRRKTAPCVETEDGTAFVRYGPDKRYPLRPAMTDLSLKLADMDRLGIDVSILSVTMPGVDGLGDDAVRVARIVNDQMAEIVSGHPTRLGWVAVLPMDEPSAASDELRRAVSIGARGAMIFSNTAGRPLDLDTDGTVFETACELDVPVLLHPAYPLTASTLEGFELVSTLGYLFDTSTAALRLVLSGMYTRYPNLKFVLCHAGSLLPYAMGRIDHQAMNRPGGKGPIDGSPSDDLRKMYIDSVCLFPPSLQLAIDFFGADHAMMGSDHPQWPMDGSVETLSALELDVDERALIESGTAAELFRWTFAHDDLELVRSKHVGSSSHA